MENFKGIAIYSDNWYNANTQKEGSLYVMKVPAKFIEDNAEEMEKFKIVDGKVQLFVSNFVGMQAKGSLYLKEDGSIGYKVSNPGINQQRFVQSFTDEFAKQQAALATGVSTMLDDAEED